MSYQTLKAPFLLGLMHGAVDASSGIVLGRFAPDLDFTGITVCYLLYNLLAFALQPALGLLVDRLDRPRATAALGLMLVALAMVLLPHSGWLALTLTGLGNAIYHLGAGVTASRSTPNRAAGPGVFIAPGALGVVLGRWLGAGQLNLLLPACAMLAVGAIIIWLAAAPALPSSPLPVKPTRYGLILACLLGAIVLRSLLGFMAVGGFANNPQSLVLLAMAACLGKGLGGLIADAVGWRLTSFIALFSSSILFVLMGQNLALAMLAIMLFQTVTGVTLTAMYRLFPGRIAWSFGLNCLALFVGALPILLRWQGALPSARLLAPLLGLITTIAVTWAVGAKRHFIL